MINNTVIYRNVAALKQVDLIHTFTMWVKHAQTKKAWGRGVGKIKNIQEIGKKSKTKT